MREHVARNYVELIEPRQRWSKQEGRQDFKRNPVAVSTGGNILLLWAHVVISCGHSPAP